MWSLRGWMIDSPSPTPRPPKRDGKNEADGTEAVGEHALPLRRLGCSGAEAGTSRRSSRFRVALASRHS